MSGNNIKDKILYLRLKQRDKEAFLKAYDLYVDSIYRFILFKVRSPEEAEDITSSVFLKTWDYIQNQKLKEYKTLKSFLYKVARNLVIDHYRKQARQQDVSINRDDGSSIDLPDEKQDTHGKIALDSDIQFLMQKLTLLKDEYREAIVLRYVDDMSISEIANILEKNKGNVRVIIYRAIKALKELAQE